MEEKSIQYYTRITARSYINTYIYIYEIIYLHSSKIKNKVNKIDDHTEKQLFKIKHILYCVHKIRNKRLFIHVKT